MSTYYNDNNPFACRVLRARIADGSLPPGDVDERSIEDVNADDLRGYDQVHLFAGIGGFALGLRMAGVPDDFPIWTGGFPCQDISVTGKGAGLAGARSGLWHKYASLIEENRPSYVIIENVAALRSRGLDQILGRLDALGYDAEWYCIPATGVGAHHLRERTWIVSYPHCGGRGEQRNVASTVGGTRPGQSIRDGENRVVAGWPPPRGWCAEPDVGRVANGLSGKVDRRKRLIALGNAVVPQVVEVIGRAILAAERPL